MLVVVAAVAGALHTANLVHITSALGCDLALEQCSGNFSLLYSPDTAGYVEVANSLRRHGLLGTSCLNRLPGYPWLISQMADHGSLLTVLWLVPLAAMAGAAATAWTASVLTASTRWGLAAGVIFCLWPAAYQYALVIGPDAIHAFLTALAVAFTLGWALRRRLGCGLVAMTLWMAVQTIRPTFFVIALWWPLLLVRRSSDAGFRRRTLAMWPLTLVIPALVLFANQMRHGVVVVSEVGAANLANVAVPRLQESLDLGDFHSLREIAWSRYADCDLETRIQMQRRESWAFFLEHPWAALASFSGELGDQLLWPPRMSSQLVLLHLYPRMTLVPFFTMHVFWLLVLAGSLVVMRSHPEAALLFLGCVVLVMIPATQCHLVEGRLRLPLDFLGIPMVVVACQAAIRRLRGTLNSTFNLVWPFTPFPRGMSPEP